MRTGLYAAAALAVAIFLIVYSTVTLGHSLAHVTWPA